ncbi:MAG: winged helix-turn-helix transcriptional regulator [Chloroflexota bacterium]|nr:MAG: winged helix-turn-helix transcriptional regulator [Chloroflexota bacterium]
MQRTRRQILEYLKRRGKASLEELATAVELVPVTVRSHLSVLERDGLIRTEEERGKVGRPHFVYSLTPEGLETFPRAYHVLAARLLAAVQDVYGVEGVDRLLQQMWDVWVDERQRRVAGKDLDARVAEVTQICSEQGCLAEWEAIPEGYLLHQYNCLTLRVSSEHLRLCDYEHDGLRRLLDARVERLKCMAAGDQSCSYRVTPSDDATEA